MASLLIRNVDEALREQLKARARRHRRSVEEEARELLRAAMARDTAGSETLPAIAERLFGAERGFDLCGSAWNRNPVGGVIGVQTGPH
ncbi:plasmid stability protein [Roseomonas mucosa]|uniref:FitA-like ribbon-helix-helix domain-containing protein n=1 Tax=Roseomonas mucosa TaxID=207340 RepID=UPI0028CD0C26|nr:plasmid stability protein [Roseomonas mucosa]MDT8278819.1 plasmid stability protein [Roseomonas mucosa]